MTIIVKYQDVTGRCLTPNLSCLQTCHSVLTMKTDSLKTVAKRIELELPGRTANKTLKVIKGQTRISLITIYLVSMHIFPFVGFFRRSYGIKSMVRQALTIPC